MKRKTRSSRRPTTRSPAEIANFVEQYDSLRNMGYTNDYISGHLGVSHSSLYRWSRALAEAKTFKELESRSVGFDINRSIAVLCSQRPDHAEFVSAIAFFASWLRWPAFPELHETGALTICLRYVREQTAATYIHELTASQRAICERFLRIDDIIKLTSLEGPAIPFLNEFNIFGQNYNDRDVISQITNYMLAVDFDEGLGSTRPSLNKAFHLLENGGFKYVWQFSKSSFQKLWREYGHASPFLFVENYGPSLHWLLVPTSNEFGEAFAEIEGNPSEIRSFMSKSKWVIGELKRRLDRRAVENLSFPSFPSDLPEMPVIPRALNARALHLLKSYTSKN